MEISSIAHIVPEQLTDFQADLFITTLSYESRSIAVAKRMEGLECRKVALLRPNPCREHAYKANLAYFQEHGFELLTQESDLPDISNILKDHVENEIRIMVDCTSMYRPWYYELFRWFGEKQEVYDRAVIRFVYTMADYVEEKTPHKVRKLEEFLKFETRKKKTGKVLIMGLGQEPKVSEDIYKQLNPDLLFLYYADSPVDKRFVKELFVNNHGLINATHIRNLIAYPINNGHAIYQSLINTILPLRDDYRITLVPQGPKIFSLACLLIKMSYPDVRIRYPRFKKDQILDRQACGEPVIMDIHFEREG
jgi:hypothetical protein